MAKANKNKAPQNTEQYSSGFFKTIIEKCDGCDRIIEVDNSKYCQTYAFPDAKWKLGICNFASHIKSEFNAIKIKINPLKAAKRASAKKK